ncbi:MAG: fumarate hydratase [Candidatus Omnitrophica bacterium]|nr:fumarate hydratase [Candidatus Omnitrophota bacterium]MCM8801703.1 fumarate hydratase [Candidatus Omnitrophota bacterium]
MRKIYSDEIVEKLSETIIEINYKLPKEIKNCIKTAYMNETEKYSKKYLDIILKNIEIAEKKRIPICQDTGLTIVFVEIGMDIKIEKGKYKNLEEIINKGVEIGSKKGFLRNSIVSAIERKNTGSNTPCVIHFLLNDSNKLKFTIIAKGFGSENKSRIKMLKPSEGKKGIENFIIETVKKAGSFPCPPLFIGVGIGGSFEKAAILSKYALSRIGKEDSKYRNWEKEIIFKINKLKIGPSGFGGNITALDLKIETYPTHIAGLPVAVNLCCWAHRIGSFEI